MNYNSQFQKSNRRFDFMFKFIVAMIILIFIGAIAMIGFQLWIAAEVFTQIQDNGLKSVVDVIWNGAKQSNSLKTLQLVKNLSWVMVNN